MQSYSLTVRSRVHYFLFLVILSASLLELSACSSRQKQSPGASPSLAKVPETSTLTPKTTSKGTVDQLVANLKEGQTAQVVLPSGYKVNILKTNGKLYHEAIGLLSDTSFKSRQQAGGALALKEALQQAAQVLSKHHSVLLDAEPSLGYFTALTPFSDNTLLTELRSVKFNDEFILNPLLIDDQSLRQVKQLQHLRPEDDGVSDLSPSNANYSGLARIHAPDFVKKAAETLGGEIVDGTYAHVGITDTGITYNHPTFLSSQGKNRIFYMKDFTKEGRVYFSPDAVITVKKLEETSSTTSGVKLEISSDVILTPKLPNRPFIDVVVKRTASFTVSPALADKILATPEKYKLGYLLEASLNSPEDPVDLNANGSQNDEIPLLFETAENPNDFRVYFNPLHPSDLASRSFSSGIRDFNTSGEVIPVFAEKVGLHIGAEKILTSDGENIAPVYFASIVGYDPGNHGSHVAGIAAGRKTIANDSDDTLARGVAPNAQIMMNRVCANNGGCSYATALKDFAMSSVKPEVINMSLGGLSAFNDGYDAGSALINRITLVKNILFVISAGNSGPGVQTIGSPSTARTSLSVAATASVDMIQKQYGWAGANTGSDLGSSDEDMVLFFSSRGPTASGGFKPNIAAPGTELSAVHFNTDRNSHGGLDVYWGTSMAAPTATGAVALLVDGIVRYNLKHPDQKMPTDARILKEVILESARFFNTKNSNYTWIDEGMGMFDLSAAWDKLLELAKSTPIPAVSYQGQAVELDYSLLTSLKNPSSLAYDGTRPANENAEPAFGSGLYLTFNDTDTLKQVHILRNLPANLEGVDEIGDLTRDLLSTADTFVLKTTFFGNDSKTPWLNAGVSDALGVASDCLKSQSRPLTVIGQGAGITSTGNGTGTIAPFNASTLNVCLDRDVLAKLPSGDHGAIISAYRKAGGIVSPVASFRVPVYVAIPHQELSQNRGFNSERTVESFGVERNYVYVPQGVSSLSITLEVPKFKAEDGCSGVELMALEGSNTINPIPNRREARVSNCSAEGRPNSSRLSVSVSRSFPKPGMWDIHVFGQYKFKKSKYKLRVDYTKSSPSVAAITGTTESLNGSLSWKLLEASFSAIPDATKSLLTLNGLERKSEHSIEAEQQLAVPNLSGSIFSHYPETVQSVTISTGGSSGNDIDLLVRACPNEITDPNDSTCIDVGDSGGSDDKESVTFKSDTKFHYLSVVVGYKVNPGSTFTFTERQNYLPESGSVKITKKEGELTDYTIEYAFNAATSTLLNTEEYSSGNYAVVGNLVLKTATGSVLDSLPVNVKK